MSETAKLYEDIKNQIEVNNQNLKVLADDAKTEAKNAGKLSEETRNLVDQALSTQTKLSHDFEKLKNQIEGLESSNDDMAQQVLNIKTQNGSIKPKSLGELVVSSDDYRNASPRFGTIEIQLKNAITTAAGSAGEFIEPQLDPELIRLPRRELRVKDLLTKGQTSSDVVKWLKQAARTNNADMVAEGAQKPESDYTWTNAETNVRKIAHWIHISEEAIMDAPMVQSEIDSELLWGLDEKEDAQLLSGDGTGQNLSGLLTNATAFTPALGAGVTDQQPIDVLRIAMLQLRLEQYTPTAIVLAPQDWAKIELLKDSTKQYLHANPYALTQPTLWGKPVVQDVSIGANQFLIGDFKRAATVYDRMQSGIRISNEDRDNFIKNMYTILAEKRLALAVKRPLALVKGALNVAMA